MALTTGQRNRLPDRDFALPGRRYPIENPAHARNALARVSQHGSDQEKEIVCRRVHERYPDIMEGQECPVHHARHGRLPTREARIMRRLNR